MPDTPECYMCGEKLTPDKIAIIECGFRFCEPCADAFTKDPMEEDDDHAM